ncbi:hypothetical protein [Xanthomonas arboricola]|uniref:hypothetical protein n=1 Tax=Xanthomonas arboricola TaxID=56448 RepID=UPI00118B1D34|nr:hypothetical protein [Xanthomonas arboricola]QDS14702.1 hypothetical protein FPL04_02910 [Xanthomonas arboricola]
MSSSNQYSPSAAVKNWKAEIIRGLKYCKENGWLLSGGIALLAAISVFNYSVRENVPINLISVSAITSLPAIFAAVACTIILLLSCVLLPTAITFIPPIAGRPTSIVRMLSDKPKFRIKARINLFLALLVPTTTTSIIIFFFSYYDNAESSLFGLAVFSSIILSTTSFIRILSGKGNRFFPHISLDFLAISIAASLIQILTWLPVLKFSLFFVTDEKNWMTGFILVSILAGLTLTLLQTFAAEGVSRLLASSKPLNHLSLTIAAIIVAMCAFPPTGSMLAGFVMQSMASGARSCVVIKWSKSGLEDPTLPSQRDKKSSIALKLMAVDGSDYLARANNSKQKEIQRIPISSVRSIYECPSNNPNNEN